MEEELDDTRLRFTCHMAYPDPRRSLSHVYIMAAWPVVHVFGIQKTGLVSKEAHSSDGITLPPSGQESYPQCPTPRPPRHP